MAETEQTEDAGGGNKKTMVLFALIVVVAIGASVGGTLLFVQGDEPEVAEQAPAQDLPTKAMYHNLRPAFIVNYVTGGKPRYLQTDLTVMARNPAVIEALVDHGPLVRSRILSYLNDQEFLELQTHEGKEALRAGLADLLNDIARQHAEVTGVESVLLTSFVLQ